MWTWDLLLARREGLVLGHMEWEGLLLTAELGSPEGGWHCGYIYAPPEMHSVLRSLPSEGWPGTGDLTASGSCMGMPYVGWDYGHAWNRESGTRTPSPDAVFLHALPVAGVIRDRHHLALAAREALAHPARVLGLIASMAPYPRDSVVAAWEKRHAATERDAAR